MSPLLWLACLPFLVITILATALRPSHLHPRQVAGAPGIVAKVISPNGTDLTSGFQTLFYHPDNGNLSNVNERDLDGRQLPRTVRAIVSCRRPVSQFRYSSCDYRSGHPMAMQRFRVICSIPSQGRHSRGSRLVTEFGSCNADEICVNGPRNGLGQATTASCIGQRSFEPIPNYNTAAGREQLHRYPLDRMSTAVVISDVDKSTPMNVQSLELDAGIAGVGHAGGAVGMTDQQKCDNCMDLETGVLEKGTDFLMTEATVAGAAGAVAAAGIIWMAALSG